MFFYNRHGLNLRSHGIFKLNQSSADDSLDQRVSGPLGPGAPDPMFESFTGSWTVQDKQEDVR